MWIVKPIWLQIFWQVSLEFARYFVRSNINIWRPSIKVLPASTEYPSSIQCFVICHVKRCCQSEAILSHGIVRYGGHLVLALGQESIYCWMSISMCNPTWLQPETSRTVDMASYHYANKPYGYHIRLQQKNKCEIRLEQAIIYATYRNQW